MLKRNCVNVAALIAMGVAMPAIAQEAAKPAQQLERVEVTGSRIKTVSADTASPVVTIGAESVKVEGARNIEALLNNLPQVFADQGSQVSNGSSGTATVNLRGLGAQRTLVLVNGRRLPAGSPRNYAADLNQIPASLIKRVEVMSGGASAIYGSDAVAGVVNFIMNDTFEGVQIDANYSFYNHSQKDTINGPLNDRKYAIPDDKSADGKSRDIGITIGGNFGNGKGNAVGFFGFKRDDALLQSERSFSACTLQADGDHYICGGSNTTFPGRFRIIGARAAGTPRDITIDKATGALRAYAPTDVYNFGPLNYFQRPSDRYSAATFVKYDIDPMARLYMEASFHDDHTVAQIAPSGLFGVQATIQYDNPLLTDAWRTQLQIPVGGTRDVLFNRRNVEGGGRQDDIRHTSFRQVVGVKGDVGPWTYDVYGQMSKVIYQETYKNDFSILRGQRALDVVKDPVTGQAVCRSVLDGTDPNCVPYNIFKLGGVTPEALKYVGVPGFQKGYTSQTVVGATTSVDLGEYGVKLPSAKNGVSMAFGVERRAEHLLIDTDLEFSTGDLAGQGGATKGSEGGFVVKDAFLEGRIPLVDKAPFAEELGLTTSYRHSSYSHAPSTNTWGLGLEWSPVKEAKFRASQQRAVRAPNIIESNSPLVTGLYNDNEDPCAGASPHATAAECARSGVKPGQYGSISDSASGEYYAHLGTNAPLKSETANTLTLGAVFQPMRDMAFTVDYFSMKVDDAIGGAPPALVLRQCMATGDAKWCNRVHRDSLGELHSDSQGWIDSFNENLAKQNVKGVDLGADYRMGVGDMGKLSFSFLGTKILKWETEPLPGLKYDCKGLYGVTCGISTPKWRHRLRTSWQSPFGLDVALTWRYIAAVKEDVTSSQPVLATLSTTNNPITAELAARHYFDISLGYKLTKMIEMRMGVQNLLDKDPPLHTQGAPLGNANTYPVLYDSLGRRISLSVTAKF